MNGQEQPQGNQENAADQPCHRTLGDRGELFVGQRHAAGDAHTGIARFDEFEPSRGFAHRPGGSPARLDAGEIELRLDQHEFVRASEIGDIAAQQAGPRQRVRATGDHIGHHLVERRQCLLVGREIGLPLHHSGAEQ